MIDLEKTMYLVEGFREKTLPLHEWTHEAHLVVAFYFLFHFDIFQAVCYLRSGIIGYNQSVGTENSPNKGYHETLSLFWAKIIKKYIEQDNEKDFLEALNDFLESPQANRNLHLEYYEAETIFSVEARAFWIEPSLKSL